MRLKAWLVSLLLPVAVVASFALLTACSGGGDDDKSPAGPVGPSAPAAPPVDNGPFNFNGTWRYSGRVVSSNNPGVPVGSGVSDTATITVAGSKITMATPGTNPLVGTCNTAAGTFDVHGSTRGIGMRRLGGKTGSTSMEGDETWTYGGSGIGIHWTMALVARQAAPAGAPAGAISLAGLNAAVRGALDSTP